MVVYMSEHERLVRELLLAIERDAPADEVAAYWHPDAEQVEHPSLVRPHGHRRGVAEMMTGYAAGSGFLARQSYDVQHVVDDGERLAVQLLWRATTATAAGDLPAGTDLVAHVAVFCEFRDGLVLCQTSYDCYEPLPRA